MRVFLFGIDGLTFRILDPYMERGLLPNFQRLQDGGVHGILRSTIPPFTPPAWMSISTGTSPAKHGVYDFWTYEQTENGPRAHVMTHRRGGKAIWNMLSELGKRVAVANVPMTYPPEPVNGIMLSGYMAPDMKADVAYPKAFKEELLEVVPGYQIDLHPAVSGNIKGDPLLETLKMTDERIAMLRLLLSKPWDFFFIVFTGADRIQHARWPEIMAFHPKAVSYYQKVDEALGMAIESLHAEDMLMVVSDHGFQGIQRQFYVQEYLYRQGLLRLGDGATNRHAEFRNRVVERIRKVLWAMKLRGVPTLIRWQSSRLGIRILRKEPVITRVPDLDWGNTHAWVLTPSGCVAGYADILLDDTLTEEQISELAAALQETRDPETGERLATIHREDAFGSGPFAPPERHLMLVAGENTMLKIETGVKNLWDTCSLGGVHHPDGILYLYGAGIKKGETIDSSHIYDVVPTILSYMGIPLPSDLDGKIITEAFEGQVPLTTTEKNSMVMQKIKKFAAYEP